MIYQSMIIDADNAILILEKVFKRLLKPKAGEDLGSGIIAQFFAAINTFIDEIQAAMSKGRDISNMNRTLLAENSSVVLHYQPEARVLVCAISDADDDLEVIIAANRKIGERFWKKHRENLENFRLTADKTPFKAFIPDIEMILRDGRVAEIIPRLEINAKTLRRIFLMGVINQDEFEVGSLIDGKITPLQISKKLKKTQSDIMNILKKLESLDIIKEMKLPKF